MCSALISWHKNNLFSHLYPASKHFNLFKEQRPPYLLRVSFENTTTLFYFKYSGAKIAEETKNAPFLFSISIYDLSYLFLKIFKDCIHKNISCWYPIG